MGTLQRSWALVKASGSVLLADKELLILPILSAIVTVIAMGALVLPVLTVPGAQQVVGSEVGALGALFAFYLVVSFVALFFNVALVGAALERLQGGDPNVWSGLGIALRHIGGILVFSVISATVGVLLSLIRGDRDNVAGQIASGLLGAAWGIITFLVVPVMIVEGVNPFKAIGRSFALLKQTWGEQIVGSAGVGLVFLIAGIPAFLVIGLGVWSGLGPASITAFVLAILYLAVLGIISSALNQVYRAAIYLYATTGKGAGPFETALLQEAFHRKGQGGNGS